MKKFIFLYISLLFGHILQAQNLENLLLEAGENHPLIKSKYAQYLASLEQIPQVGTLPDPTLGIAPFILPVETRVGTQRLKLGLNQQFPWFGTLKARKEVSAQKALEQLQELQIIKNQLYFNIRKSYYNLYQVRHDQILIEENQKLLESYEQLVLKRYENNKAPLSDIFQIQIQQKEIQRKLESLAITDSTLLVELNTQLGRNTISEIQIPTDFLSTYSMLNTQITDSLFEQNPSIQLFAQKQESIKAQQALLQKEALPKFSIGLDYVLVSPIENSQVQDNGKDVLMPMLGLSIPIFSAKKTKARAKELALQTEALNFAKENLNLQLQAEYYKYLAQKTDAQLQLKTLKEQVELCERTIKLLLENYTNNQQYFEDILILQQQLLGYQLAQNNAIRNQLTASAGIFVILGSQL